MGVLIKADKGPLIKGPIKGLETDSAEVREAALEGLLIADEDGIVLELFRASRDPGEKRELLELLVMMDSDAVWDIIDSTLENGE